MQTSKEGVQFTRAATDEARQWILFDQQLMSPVDPRQKAVYVMAGTSFGSASILQLHHKEYNEKGRYDLRGYRIGNATHGLYIVDGKKIFRK